MKVILLEALPRHFLFISFLPVFYQGLQSKPHPYLQDRHSHPLPPLSCLGIAPPIPQTSLDIPSKLPSQQQA